VIVGGSLDSEIARFGDATNHSADIDQIYGSCVLGKFSQNCACTKNCIQGSVMRISDDRYSRERLCLDLALRFLRHEARTQTIRKWTGLSDDRIRNLYRSYMSRGAHFVPRHRGKSPHQVAYFSRSLRVQWETAQLASMLCLFSVVPPHPSPHLAVSLPTVARGEKLCYAFEVFQTTIPESQISFEHSVFLAVALARGDQLRLGGCRDCGGLLVLERLPIRERRCQYCASIAER
jgi:hypothetical protein